MSALISICFNKRIMNIYFDTFKISVTTNENPWFKNFNT